MKLLAPLVAGLMIAALSSAASAQTYSASVVGSNGGVAPVGGFGGGYGGGFAYGYHSSTAEEGILRGAADLTRASGEANYYNSLASINHQQALSQAIQNRQLRIEGYFRGREINRQAREIEKSKSLTPAQHAAIARRAAPDRLTVVQYDRMTGQLDWPIALTGANFDAERDALDQIFAARGASDAGVGSAFHANVQQITSAMLDQLSSEVGYHTPMDYVAARKFLTGVAYEAQHPLGLQGLAAR